MQHSKNTITFYEQCYIVYVNIFLWIKYTAKHDTKMNPFNKINQFSLFSL